MKSSHRTQRLNSTPRMWKRATGVLLLLIAAFSSSATSAAPEPDTFHYVMENRADPFLPFITEKSASAGVDMNEIVDSEEPLTGMQLFEPGQLTLVALLQTGANAVAMVEDFTGKGYILTEGTKIGKRGIVTDIASNSVIIEETARTRAGKEIITKVVMTLKKEETKE